MGFISWMADKLGIGDSKKKKKKKTTSKGITSVVKDMSHVSKDAATINSKSTSAKQKQAARNRISSYKSGNDVYKTGKVYQSDQNRSSRVSGQSKKTTTKKRDERSTFEKFSQSQLKSIKAGATKTNTPKQDTKKLSNAYDAYKKRLESDRAKKKAEEEKKARQELSKNSLVQMQKSQQETLNKLRAERKKLKEGNLAKADPQKEIDKLNKEIRAVKNDRKFAKSYKKEQGEKAKKQLDKQLKSMSLSGTQETKKKVEQKAEEEKKRKQEVLDKVYNRRVDKREDNSKMSDTEKASIYTDPVRAAAARSGNPKTVYTKKQREEMRKSVQKGLDKGQFGAGLLQGSMLGGDLYDAVEKQYGIKLDRTKYNKSTSAKVGEAVGMLAMSAVPGATTEAAAAKSLTKALAKVTGKKATSKAAKAAATIAAESAASLPMNVADAAKNSEDGKTFAKNLAENVALDAGLNGVMEGASALLKNTAKSKAGQALVKMGKGENLTQQEQDAFNKVVSRAAAKSATNKKLNKLEEVALQTAQNRNTKKNLTSAFAADVGPVPTATEAKSSQRSTASALMSNDPQPTSKTLNASASTNTIPKSTINGNAKTTYLKKEDVDPKYTKTYQEFVDNVDEELVDYVNRAKEGKVGKRERHKFGGIKRGEADKIEQLTGKNVDGYAHSIGVNDLEHIERRHGIKGQADHTMADVNDIGRIRYVVENYDNIKRTVNDKGEPQFTNAYLDKEMKPSPLITYEKRVDGHVYVVEAVADTSKKEVRVLSAYMNAAKKEKAPYTANANAPASTSDNAYTDASTTNIPESSVKSNTSEKKIGDTVTEKDFSEPVDFENDPHVRDILADPDGKVTKETSSFVKKFTEVKDIARQKTVDSLQGVEKMGRKLGGEQGKMLVAQASALRRSGEKATFNLLQKQTDFNNHVIGKGGFEILSPIRKLGDDAYDDFNAYLFHKLNIDRYKNGKTLWGEDVVPPEKSRQIIKQFDEKYAIFKDVHGEVIQYLRNLNTVRVQSGLISKNQKDILEEMYENYVPAHRNIDKRAGTVDAEGIRVDTGIRRAKGGDQAILPIHEQMAYATQRTWKAAELNETIRQIAKAQGLDEKYIAKEIVDNQDPEDALEDMLNRSTFFEEGSEKGNKVKAIYYENGKEKETWVSKLVFDGLKQWAPSDKHIMLDTSAFDKFLTGFENMAKSANDTSVGKALIKANNGFKALITSYNPFFLIRNGLKDMQDIPVNSSSLSGFIKNMPKAYKAMMKSLGGEKDPLWETYLAAGVRYSGLFDPKKAMVPSKGFMGALKKYNPIKLLEDANMAIESYPRFVEFCNILDQLGVKDVKNATREQIERAAKGASDVTCDFGRTGSLTAPVNRSAVPFLNASIQGADKLWRVLSGQKGFRGYVALAGKLAALGATPAVAQEIIYANDPDYQQLNARDRASYYFIKNADGTFWKIPRGRTTATLMNPVQQAARAFVGNDKMSFDEFKEQVLNNLAPVSPRDAHIFSQMINTLNNQTWYGGTIEGWSDQYNDDGTEKPKVERYDPNTSKFAIEASKKWNELLTKAIGAEKAEKLTMSPQKIHYLIDSYTGIVGDIGLSATKLNRTQSWWKQTFDTNFKKDPVYSNNLATKYYELKEKSEAAAKKMGATQEDKALQYMLKVSGYNLSDLKEMQDSIRYDQDMSMKEKSQKDREIQKEINKIYRDAASPEAVKAYKDFIKNNKDKYMSNEGLIKAAQREHEKVTHATVKTMDMLYKYGGMKAVLKGNSAYKDDYEDKQKLTFSHGKSIKQIYKRYHNNKGSDDAFYSVYRAMTKANKERGIGTNSKYGNLAAIEIRTGGYKPKERERLREAFGVSEDSRNLVNKYFKQGGSRREYMKAAEAAESTAGSLRQKKTGDKYNYFAPFKARGIADLRLPDRAYMVVDSAEAGRKTSYYVNNSRGLKHYKISAQRLQQIDNKCAKDEKGYTTSEGLQKVLDKTNYNREEKALIWEALYGLSYRTANPYGSIRDYSLKSDVGIDTSGGWKNYGSGYRRYYGGGYRRYGGYGRSYGRTGGSGGSGSSDTEEMSEFEKYTSDLLASIQAGDIEAAKMNYGSRKLKQKYGDSYSKAVAKLLAKQVFKS